MGDDERRSGSMPHPKATTLFARTVYRELRRASYDEQDLVRFVGDLMEMIASGLRVADPELDRRLAGVVDPETGLPNRGTFHEIVEFEMRDASPKGVKLLLACVEVSIPEWCPDDVARRIHARTANAIRNRVRPDDVVARLSPTRYAVLMPRAGDDVIPVLAARLAPVLAARRRGNDAASGMAGVAYSVRAASLTPEMKTADALIDECLARGPVPLELEERAPPPAARASLRNERRREEPRGALEVVLALGGGAVRAAAHAGVVAALREAGVEIVGIAGTSAGALVGAMLLSGQSHASIVQRFEAFRSTTIYGQIRRLYAQYAIRAKRSARAEKYFRQSGLAFSSETELAAVPDELFASFIEYFVGPDRDFATLSHPFSATAMDIVEGRPVIFTRGPLHQALRASCAVPGLFAPQREGARMLIDGATTTEVPVAAALALRRAAPTLAVHLERPASKIGEYRSSAEVITRAASLIHTELVREQLRGAPVLFTAPVGEIGWLDFRHARNTYEIGLAAARAAIGDLLRELHDAAGSGAPA
jgi:NTE family protein